MSNIISKTSNPIYDFLLEIYITPPPPLPKSQENWLNISKDFEELWNTPHVIGCIDGKHIRFECPQLSGSIYHNYKGFFSIVLLAVCDAKYCLILFDLGQYGSNNDSWILANSQMGQMFEKNELNVPEDVKLEETLEQSIPYFLLGDEALPLKT